MDKIHVITEDYEHYRERKSKENLVMIVVFLIAAFIFFVSFTDSLSKVPQQGITRLEIASTKSDSSVSPDSIFLERYFQPSEDSGLFLINGGDEKGIFIDVSVTYAEITKSGPSDEKVFTNRVYKEFPAQSKTEIVKECVLNILAAYHCDVTISDNSGKRLDKSYVDIFYVPLGVSGKEEAFVFKSYELAKQTILT